MKYLVIGDANSMHIYNFVKHVLVPNKFTIYLLTLSIKPIKREYRSFYQENGVFVHSIADKGYKNVEKTDVFNRVLNVFRKFLLLREVPKVDICHLQSVYKTAVAMILSKRCKYDKLILSYWGGDLLERSPNVLKLVRKGLRRADAITVTVKQSLNVFHNIFGSDYDEKLLVSRFATAGLNCIHSLSQSTTRDECRAMYGIPEGKVCITCGYSAYREQHQDRCIQEIGKLPEALKDKIYCIVPMQYGRINDKEYLEDVQSACEKSGVEYKVLREFVPFEMSARLAIATDIYLHLRDTDAFSNALKEHVYSGSKVVKGDWLKYIELEEMQAAIVSISSFDELNKTLEKLVSEHVYKNEIELFSPIYELYSTESIVEQWDSVIKKVL